MWPKKQPESIELPPSDLDQTKKLSGLDHKYASIEGVVGVLKNNQLETDKWLLSTVSQKNPVTGGQNGSTEVLKNLFEESERKLNDSIASAEAARINDMDEVRNRLKQEIMEELEAKLAAKESKPKAFDLEITNETDILRQVEELRADVLANTQLPASCAELYRRRGMSNEGEQLVADIDPDGFKAGNFPVRVRCFRERGRVYTEIDSDPKGFVNISNISNSDNQTYFRRNLTYSVPMSQIVALIDISEGCGQEFKFAGYRAGLSNLGAWQDRNGEWQVYFDGSNYGLQGVNSIVLFWPKN